MSLHGDPELHISASEPSDPGVGGGGAAGDLKDEFYFCNFSQSALSNVQKSPARE